MRRLVIALMCCLVMPGLRAQQTNASCQVGTFLRLVGTVSLQRETPAVGRHVCLGDKIVTGPASIAELRLRDGSLITVGKDSEFTIREFRIYRQQPNVALFELGKGAFRSITGFITRRAHRFEVLTAVATIGVRGTDFWGGYGLTENGLDVVMLGGKGVYVETAAGRVELDRPGLGTTVVAGAVTPAKSWGEDKLKRAVATITP